ncbi:MAG TPA: bifunctional phosphopantothenoylcysteine decarboxylase/phosphopantothenate--cysteine ligase CoaBC, partial [Pyrinomonadaceae bacterium]|nr:bifunctional phosphopantothenoylcysteine decarboxylase/phosphopantothenate--cysteine ligase CoaBC [Pyrinomonadaceae bacterium]
GRLNDPEIIVAAALKTLRKTDANAPQDLAGERLLLTTGATREVIDPVRFLTNSSSGLMGFAIAEAAKRRGASVTVVAAATTVEPPSDVEIIRAYSAEEMYAAVLKEVQTSTIFIGAAAVSDYRPVKRSSEKIKKTVASLILELEQTPDILNAVSSSRCDGLLVIGFAAETENVLANAREKLERKSLDAIVANDVTREGAGFDTPTNEVTILIRGQKAPIHVPLMAKTNVANIILDEVVRLRARANETSANVRHQSPSRVK